jgi:hypothetical protein
MPGDIFLTRTHTISGRINAAYQRIRRQREFGSKLEFIPTHAALALSGDFVIHSNKHSEQQSEQVTIGLRAAFELLITLGTKGSKEARQHPEYPKLIKAARTALGHGVDIDSISNLIGGLTAEDVLLLRHPDLQKKLDPVSTTNLFQESLYHIDRPYNVFVELSEGMDTAVFCSQLVYQVFTAVGISVPSTAPKRVLPIDLLNWARRGDWQIVEGKDVFAALAERDCEAPDHSLNDIVSSSVNLHRAAVEHIHRSRTMIRSFQQLNHLVAELVSKSEPVRFSASDWMRVGAAPVKIRVAGLLIAADTIGEASGIPRAPSSFPNLVAENDRFSDDEPAKGDKPISWLLDRSSDEEQANADDASFRARSAAALLNFASDILDQFDVAVMASLQLLKELDDSPLNFGIESLQNDSTKLFLYIARFIDRSETLEALRTQDSNIAERRAAVQSKLSELAERIAEPGGADEAGKESTQGEIVTGTRAFMGLLDVLHSYAIASDFADAAQWLKLSEGGASLEKMIEVLASEKHPLLHESFETLNSLGKMRHEVEKLKRLAATRETGDAVKEK